MSVVIATAGWSIPTKDAAAFIPEGTALERYASRFGGVEVNSSFYRRHRPATLRVLYRGGALNRKGAVDQKLMRRDK